MNILNALIVEDNKTTLEELLETLPIEIDDYELLWTPCASFDEAIKRITAQRFDIVVTDIYVDEIGHEKSYAFSETGARGTIERIRDHRFCPVLAVTDGSKPENFPEGPFIGFADKTKPDLIEEALVRLIHTGIPALARKLHDELDQDASQYLWNFLEGNWNLLSHTNHLVLERLLKRRASILLSKVDQNLNTELAFVEGPEYYIYPSIAGDEYRLGEVIRHKENKHICVILTPHCHLTVQPNDTEPRAEFILTVHTLDAKETIEQRHPVKNVNKKKPDEIRDSIRRRIQGPAGVGIPAGRYWFLPGFLEIPDLYCDFLQLNSISYSDLKNNYESIAVLDTPFAESLQGAFTAFYSAVGTPNLHPDRFNHLLDINEH